MRKAWELAEEPEYAERWASLLAMPYEAQATEYFKQFIVWFLDKEDDAKVKVPRCQEFFQVWSDAAFLRKDKPGDADARFKEEDYLTDELELSEARLADFSDIRRFFKVVDTDAGRKTSFTEYCMYKFGKTLAEVLDARMDGGDELYAIVEKEWTDCIALHLAKDKVMTRIEKFWYINRKHKSNVAKVNRAAGERLELKAEGEQLQAKIKGAYVKLRVAVVKAKKHIKAVAARQSQTVSETRSAGRRRLSVVIDGHEANNLTGESPFANGHDPTKHEYSAPESKSGGGKPKY